MREVRFTVPGEPVAWMRPGISWRGGSGRGFTYPKPEARKEQIAWVAKENWRRSVFPPLGGPLVVGFAHFREKPARGLDHPTQRPDLDNYDKLVLDALQGIVYADDSQVVGTLAWPEHGKHYAGGQDDPLGTEGKPRTEIVVMTLEEFEVRQQPLVYYPAQEGVGFDPETGRKVPR